ncbi:DUF2934 domain-containing protein [Rhizobium sp. 57MFTsu3.2]|jgi:hypothetical protein|uniref:DUF2934 domain-containing protein n=1 Tax=unclassified Rhizobium TaxID=2613769 RepID=UPI0032B2EE8E|nr:Protein of unknown function (DUF2934) [Rhizobium sp. 57MFTsu3.2]
MMADNRQDWIAHRAYALWEQAGRPYWEDKIHWRQAVLEGELSSSRPAPLPTVRKSSIA